MRLFPAERTSFGFLALILNSTIKLCALLQLSTNYSSNGEEQEKANGKMNNDFPMQIFLSFSDFSSTVLLFSVHNGWPDGSV